MASNSLGGRSHRIQTTALGYGGAPVRSAGGIGSPLATGPRRSSCWAVPSVATSTEPPFPPHAASATTSAAAPDRFMMFNGTKRRSEVFDGVGGPLLDRLVLERREPPVAQPDLPPLELADDGMPGVERDHVFALGTGLDPGRRHRAPDALGDLAV